MAAGDGDEFYPNGQMKRNGHTGDEFYPNGQLKRNGETGEEYYEDGSVKLTPSGDIKYSKSSSSHKR